MNNQYIFNNNPEIYATIPGYEDYAVSPSGNVVNKNTQRILKPGTDGSGYLIVNLCKNGRIKTFIIHRLVANAFLEKVEGKTYVDHIDNDKLNNNVYNLRWCTASENKQNSKKYKNNTCGFKGVSKSGKKFRAYIRINHIQIHIGTYKTEAEAAIAYNAKAKEIFGVFANLNIIPQ